MKEYPIQIPSQRPRTAAGSIRTIAANPPRQRPDSVSPDTVRPTSTISPDAVRRTGTVSPDAVRPTSTISPDTVRRTGTVSPDVVRRTDTVSPDAVRRTNTTSPDAVRRRSARVRRTPPRRHTLHAILTASAVMYLALFLMPFLFTSDAGSGSVRKAVSAGADRFSDVREEAVTEADTLAAVADAEALNAADAEAVPEDMPFAGQLDEDCFLRVLNRKYDEVSVMSMREYLICVLRGEMPGYFEKDALKAQAVAARTYTRYMLHSGSKHGDRADICTSPACCQAYLSAAAAREKWGYLPEDEEEKLRAAVIETDGETMLYDGEPILAVFHASSSGLTRTSGDVWSGDKPYLQPVTSPENADNTPNYYSHVEFTTAALREKLHSAFPKANLSGDTSEWLTDAERDSAGNVITIYVGGIKTQGSKVRSALGLRSACFTWEYGDGKATFYVTGYGHGVGLSQYGANQMARDGADYRAILTHYYTGIRIGGYTP